jgi:hypothetical protein
VIVLGVGLLTVYLGRLLLAPVEEAVLVTEARTLCEPPPPEQYRLLGPRLLRIVRAR